MTLSPKMISIEMYRFEACFSLTPVEGMSAIQHIRWRAFDGCSSLTSIDVKKGADIDEDAFYDCNAKVNYIL